MSKQINQINFSKRNITPKLPMILIIVAQYINENLDILKSVYICMYNGSSPSALTRSKSNEVTLETIKKSLNHWMNKQQKSQISKQSNFVITEALESVFNLLKDTFQNSSEGKYKFDDLLKTYIKLFLSTGNNQHRYLVEQHIKNLLDHSHYDKFRYNQKFYTFLCKIFYYYPFLVFRILQSKYRKIFSVDYEKVIELYALYIKFANNRKNEKLLEEYIQIEINTLNGTLQKLNILLKSYNTSYPKILKPFLLKQIIDIIDMRNQNWASEKSEQRSKILNFCQTMYAICWPKQMVQIKPNITIRMIKVWEKSQLTSAQKKIINLILETITINEGIQADLKELIRAKIKEKSKDIVNFGLNAEFAKLIISKLDKQQSQTIADINQFKEMIEQIICHHSTCQEKIELLEVIRAKKIFDLSNFIEHKLGEIIRRKFVNQYGSSNQLSKEEGDRLKQIIFALKIIRIYNFQEFNNIYCLFKQYILKNKSSRGCNIDLKKQILLVCLYILKHKKFKTSDDEKRAFKDIIDLIGQQIQLKIMMIQYIVDHLSDQFYNQHQIYSIYKESKYECLLYEDYTTNDMAIKLFSIKTICYLASDTHSQYTFFLKNAFFQLYDRLSIKYLINPEEKEICLKLIREIMRHRAELFENQANDLSELLINQFHTSIQFHSPQTNSISIIIFKIFQALLKKIPMKMISFAKRIVYYIICIMNFKILKKQLKKIAIETFCDMAYHCNYVILPYFHFKNLYFIIREILRSDDHYYFYQVDLLRLIGQLGFINQQNFVGLQVANSCNLRVDENFQNIFKEITFIKNIKDKKYSLMQKRTIAIEDGFYNDEKATKSCIQIQNYRFFIMDKIIKNISLSSLEVKLDKTLKTVLNIIPILNQQQDQRTLHELLFSRLFDIETKYTNEVLNIILEILSYHQLQEHYCKKIQLFYLKKIYNHKRELDLIKMFCVITDRYKQYVDDGMNDIIVTVKKIITDYYLTKEEESKIKLCFSIIINMADKIDHILHLFFIDLIKIFSNNKEKDDKDNEFYRIPSTISSDFFSLIVHLTKKCPSIQYFLPSIRQCLVDYLNRETQSLRKHKQCGKIYENNKFMDKTINTMLCLMVIYGKRCQSFINILEWNIKNNQIFHIFYKISLDYFKRHSNLDYIYSAFTEEELNELFYNDIKTFSFQKHYKHFNNENIALMVIKQFQKLSIQENHTQQQEDLWIDNLSNQLFRHSSQPFLRACIDFTLYDKLFAYEVFDVPFYFFWKGLSNQQQSRMTMKIKNILFKKTISLRVRQKLLETIYFIERCQTPFIIKDKLLSDVAIEVQDQVKALFYLERQYQNDPELYRQSLIQQYAEIGQKESAMGLLKSMKAASSTNTKLYIKLSQKISASSEQFLRQFQSLKENKEGLGRKEKFQKQEKVSLLQLQFKRDAFNWQGISKDLGSISQANRSKFAYFAIEAAANLGNWQDVRKWMPDIQQKNLQEASIWTIMLQIQLEKFQQAHKLLIDIRQNNYYKIRQMFNFSYEKSMKGVLFLQQISELQQILQFNRFVKFKDPLRDKNQIEVKQKQLITVWNDRFQGIKKNLDAIQKILFVRGLLLNKKDNIDHWMIFCKLALVQNKKSLGKNIYNILSSIMTPSPGKEIDEIKLLELRFIHHEIDIKECMTTYFDALLQIQQVIREKKLTQDKKSIPLIFQIYYKYAQGIMQSEDMTKEEGKKLLQILDQFPKQKDYYELSHIMGLTHIKILQIYYNQFSNKKQRTEKKVSKDQENDSFRKQQKVQIDQRKIHLQDALRCFLSSVTTNSVRQNKYFLQDCLKILNLISMGSQASTLIDIVHSRYKSIPSEGLIEFIPQIIARIDNNYGQNQKYIGILKTLLIYIGTNHPQALLFPLIFLRRGKNSFKKNHADQIYNYINQNKQNKQNKYVFEDLYEEGETVVEQLCKISLKLSQKVYIFLNKILKNIKDNKIKSMQIPLSEKIIQFCTKILKQNESISSQSQFGFVQQQKQTLILIIQYLVLYTQLEEQYYFNEAITLIKKIVNQTKQALNFIKMIYLEQASATLSKIKGSKVCLFGNYTPFSKIVTIDSFKNEIQIITSKQRPKKIVIIGTDNKEYNYLLKGKEDLRLDERIMQLFSFINKMFHSPSEKQNYSIQGYSITPINFQIGIISWVQNCDTIGDLVVDYRKNNNIGQNSKKVWNLQYDECYKICPTYGTLSKYHKVQIFKEIENIFSGNDLKNIFWKRSVTSQKWLKCRSCFTRSLAVMSIVGYIIGLGDRHPFNIMLHRDTGKVVHIDFGDCFQVTKMKNYYPQKVPFRLTRMLVNAMEACKTDGIFKQTCQKIMKILRNNKQSILVIVQAFRYDPLIGWKITSKGDKQDEIMVENNDFQFLQGSQQKSKIKSGDQHDEAESTKHILTIIKNKLHGIYDKKHLSQSEHVDKLIKEATLPLNLVQHWKGWLIYW